MVLFGGGGSFEGRDGSCDKFYPRFPTGGCFCYLLSQQKVIKNLLERPGGETFSQLLAGCLPGGGCSDLNAQSR